MIKILLIVPPYISYENYTHPAFNERVIVRKSGSYGSVVTDMPIGLLSISAYLKKHLQVEVKLVDFNTELNSLSDFAYNDFSAFYRDVLAGKDLTGFIPDIVGISALFTTTFRNMLDAADTARRLFPNSLIVVGGGVATNMYKDVFAESKSIDALCFGEGEKPLLELAGSDDKPRTLRDNRSWITREKIEQGQSFSYSFIQDLDEIPFYDYELLNPKKYNLNPTAINYTSFDGKKDLFHVATSRGCPNLCTFCASHTVHGRKMRYHSVERIREDFTRLAEKFGADGVGIQDDHFMADKKRAYAILDIAKELKLKVFFQSGLALRALDRNMLEKIKSFGINELVLAIESGSDRVLKELMKKPLKLDIVRRVIADCRELGIDTDANILIGLPGETKKDIEDTRQFLGTLDANWFRIYIATPLVGSEMYDICVKKGYLKGSHIGSDFKRAVVETEDFDAEYIQEKVYALNLELNFVRNSDMRRSNYEKALKGFENTMRVKSDHALAYYFAAKCCVNLRMPEKASVYKAKYNEIINESAFWRNYAAQFKLAEFE